MSYIRNKCPRERNVPPIHLGNSERLIILSVSPEKGDLTSAKELFVSALISFLNIYPTLANQRESGDKLKDSQVCNRCFKLKVFYLDLPYKLY